MKQFDNIGFLLHHLSFSLARQSEQVLQDELGIGFSQFKIMMVLQKKPNIRQNQIAEKLGQTEASVSRQIKLMHDDGLLQSTPKAEDRRENITSLTTRGLRISEQAWKILEDFQKPMFKTLSKDQQTELLTLLTVLHDNVCAAEGCRSPLSSKQKGNDGKD